MRLLCMHTPVRYQVGFAFAVTATVYMVGALPIGRATDKLGTGTIPYNLMLGTGFLLYTMGEWVGLCGVGLEVGLLLRAYVCVCVCGMSR